MNTEETATTVAATGSETEADGTVVTWTYGAKARYKGSGTINGTGDYEFLLVAIDGQVNGGGGVDKFRMKIRDKLQGRELVYDNELNAEEDADPTTVLGGGSIVIHKDK